MAGTRWGAMMILLLVLVGCGTRRPAESDLVLSLDAVVAQHSPLEARVAWQDSERVHLHPDAHDDHPLPVGSVAKLLILLFLDEFPARELEGLSRLMELPECNPSGDSRTGRPTADEVALHRAGVHQPPGRDAPCYDERLRGIRLYSNAGYVVLANAIAPPTGLARWIGDSLHLFGLDAAEWHLDAEGRIGISGTSATSAGMLELGAVVAQRVRERRGLVAQYLDDLRVPIRVGREHVDAYQIAGSEDGGSAELWIMPARDEILVLQARGRYAPEVFDELRAAAFRRMGWEPAPPSMPALSLVAGRYVALDASAAVTLHESNNRQWQIRLSDGVAHRLRRIRTNPEAWAIDAEDLARLDDAPGLVWEPIGDGGVTIGLRTGEHYFLLTPAPQHPRN